MGDDFFEENDDLLDDDNALDFILYEKMEEETSKPSKNAGCLTSLIFMVSAAGSLTVAVIFTVLY